MTARPTRQAMAEELLELEVVERTADEAARFVAYYARKPYPELERHLERRRAWRARREERRAAREAAGR